MEVSPHFVMAASRGSANRPPRNSSAPVVEHAAYPVEFWAHFITTGEVLGSRFALPRDAAMTECVDEMKSWNQFAPQTKNCVTELKQRPTPIRMKLRMNREGLEALEGAGQQAILECLESFVVQIQPARTVITAWRDAPTTLPKSRTNRA